MCHLKVPYHLTKEFQPFDPPLPWRKDERFVCVHGCKTGCAVSWANCNHSLSFRSGSYANYINMLIYVDVYMPIMFVLQYLYMSSVSFTHVIQMHHQ